MQKQKYIFESTKKRDRKGQSIKPMDIEYVHKKDGYYDGKIFYSKEKATYTFVDKDEVIVLHFDLTKESLFLKGHKILSIDAHPKLDYYLSKFKKCLLDNAKTKKFVKPFDNIVSNLCSVN